MTRISPFLLAWLVSSTRWPDLAGEYTGDKRGSKNRGGGRGNANLFKSSLQGLGLPSAHPIS